MNNNNTVSEEVNTRNVTAIRDFSIATRELVRGLEQKVAGLEAAVGTLGETLTNLQAQMAAIQTRLLNRGPTSGNLG